MERSVDSEVYSAECLLAGGDEEALEADVCDGFEDVVVVQDCGIVMDLEVLSG